MGRHIQTLIRDQYEFNPATVKADFFLVPVEAGEEMEAIGTKLLPDVPVCNIHGNCPQEVEITLPPVDLE
jgi:hypothetical protein